MAAHGIKTKAIPTRQTILLKVLALISRQRRFMGRGRHGETKGWMYEEQGGVIEWEGLGGWQD